MRSIGQSMSRVGRDMTMKVTAPILGLGAASVKAFANFDDAMTKSLAIFSDMTDEMRSQMEIMATDVSSKTITSATERYFATKGLMYTYRGGKQIDTTYLHVKDWIDSIRRNGTPKCHIEFGFQEGIACHMATRSYMEGRKVAWDPIRRRIV